MVSLEDDLILDKFLHQVMRNDLPELSYNICDDLSILGSFYMLLGLLSLYAEFQWFSIVPNQWFCMLDIREEMWVILRLIGTVFDWTIDHQPRIIIF